MVELQSLPPILRRYILSHTRKNSKIRNQLVNLFHRLLNNGAVRYAEIKNLGVKYHVNKLRRFNILKAEKKGREVIISLNPKVLQ